MKIKTFLLLSGFICFSGNSALGHDATESSASIPQLLSIISQQQQTIDKLLSQPNSTGKLSLITQWLWGKKYSIAALILIGYIIKQANREGTKTRALILRLFEILNIQHQEAREQRQILLNGINDLRARTTGQEPLEFPAPATHCLENPDISYLARAKRFVSKTYSAASNAWNFMRSTSRLLRRN